MKNNIMMTMDMMMCLNTMQMCRVIDVFHVYHKA